MPWDSIQTGADARISSEALPHDPGLPATGEPMFLKALVQGMRCGIVAVDVDGTIHLINGIAREILELGSVPLGSMASVALGDHPHLVQVLQDAFRLSTLPNRAELELGRGGGKTIGFTLSPIPASPDTPRGIAMFFKDLTQIEHSEEQERLRDRFAALGQMAASLAHEIRNPLASIEVSCSLLKRKLSGDSGSLELLGRITSEVRRLNATVGSSLEYVRPLTPKLEISGLDEVLDEAVAVAVDRRGRPGIRVERRFDPSVPAFLMDRRLLQQVFENLIVNAMEAVGDEGVITVSTEGVDAPAESSVPYRPDASDAGDGWPRADRFVVVRVADDGPGIDAEDLDRIFYPMFTTKKQGSGIGLAVVRKIVNSHHGMIDVESTPDTGAEFSIRIPMALSTAEVPGR